MSLEKLTPLRRQRELVQQHLDWLDAEIANQSEGRLTLPHRETSIAPALDPVDPAGADITAPFMTPDPLSSSTEAKRGCLILFFIVIGLFAAALVGIYFWKYRDRPVLFSENASMAPFRQQG